MFCPSQFLRQFVCLSVMLFMPLAVGRAQEILPPVAGAQPVVQGGESNAEPTGQLDVERPLVPGTGEESRDPTTPPTKLLDRIPKPGIEHPASGHAVTKSPAFAPLPELPKVSLKGVVLSTPDRGTAVLNVNDKSVTISLLPKKDQQRIIIPEMQFVTLQPALQQRLTANQQASGQAERTTVLPKYEMCLQCSFAVDEMIFNLEAFTRDTVLLRAMPHDVLIIVRK